MSSLTFNDVTLNPVSNDDGQIWLSSSELAKALGYKQADSVTKIYNRKSDEFAEDMTTTVAVKRGGQVDRVVNDEVIETTDSVVSPKTKGLITKTRIFSLRGCHLIGMFARTKIAKQFRIWVLDVLDKEVGEPVHVINEEQQWEIQQAVNKKVYRENVYHATVYGKLKAKFKVPKYNRLPFDKFDECMLWLDPTYKKAVSEEVKPTNNVDNAQLYKICHDFVNMGIQHLTLVHNLNISMHSENDSQLRDIAQRVKGAIDFSKQNNLTSRNGSLMMQKDRITCFNGSRESYGDDKMAMLEYYAK